MVQEREGEGLWPSKTFISFVRICLDIRDVIISELGEERIRLWQMWTHQFYNCWIRKIRSMGKTRILSDNIAFNIEIVWNQGLRKTGIHYTVNNINLYWNSCVTVLKKNEKKTKILKQSVLHSGGSYCMAEARTAWRRLVLHGGGSYCMVEARTAWWRLVLHSKSGGQLCA